MALPHAEPHASLGRPSVSPREHSEVAKRDVIVFSVYCTKTQGLCLESAQDCVRSVAMFNYLCISIHQNSVLYVIKVQSGVDYHLHMM